MQSRPIALVIAGCLVLILGIFYLRLRRMEAVSSTSGPDLSGVWIGKPMQSYNPADPSGSNLFSDAPYLPWALDRIKEERPGTGPKATFDTNDPALKYTDPDGYPRVLLHPFKLKFVVTPEFIYQLFQYQQNWRAIAMNRSHPPDPDPSWFGDAAGHFEGDTLVVDTIAFNDRTWLDPIGQPHSDALHVVERIRRIDHNTLRDDITFEDSKAYSKPWTGQLTFTLDPTSTMDEGFSTLSDELRFQNDIIKPSRANSPGR